jgi:elongation factor G
MTDDIRLLRNIGISAHIDAGKTTLSERILFYTNKIHAMHEVKGRDGVGATMDHMELERKRGITITSASTNVEWNGHSINIIDTPGHVDFTIEVERSLRVLDGAVLVLCAVGGVQSQSLTVDRQLKRYGVPRLVFINKCDRLGADPEKVCRQVRERLGVNAVAIQLPIGRGEQFEGIVDLVGMQACYFDGERGETVRHGDIPAGMKDAVRAARESLLNAASMFSDELAEAWLDGRETPGMIRAAIRRGTIDMKLAPVLMGSAYKNKGVQPCIDAVVDYLPSPLDVRHTALDMDNGGAETVLTPDSSAGTVALAFKLEDGVYGQLSYIRIYQGSIEKGCELINTRTGRKTRVGRLIRPHASDMEAIAGAGAGDIVALFGIDCVSGDTFCGGGLTYALTSMHVPEPVISRAITPRDRKSADGMEKALRRFTKEDPTFRTYVDPESNQTILQGMGELHLDIYIERMRMEYGVEVDSAAPQVAYRESISAPVAFDYTHRKQTGGAGQYARVAGRIEPCADTEYEFVDEIRGGAIPTEYVPSCDKGFRACLAEGTFVGFPVVGVKVTVNDGNSHPVDSSDLAFQLAAIAAFRQAYEKAGPFVLEPIMKVEVEGPPEFEGSVLASINQRRGMIIATTEDMTFTRVEAEVPLSEMFGYSTVLRSCTQGRAEFTMEFSRYARVPASISDTLRKQFSASAKTRQRLREG